MDWSQVTFTDELPLKLYHVPNRKKTISCGAILVRGGITARGLTKLHIIPQKTSIDSSYYISEIFEKEVKPAFSRVATSTDLTATTLFLSDHDGCFQQDSACAHISKATITWLKNNIGHYLPPEDWPPIENVWSIMGATIYASPEPQTYSYYGCRSKFS